MTEIGALPRNDVEAAMRFYRARLDDGTLTPSDVSSLFMLQDDPGPLRAALMSLAKDARVAHQIDEMTARARARGLEKLRQGRSE